MVRRPLYRQVSSSHSLCGRQSVPNSDLEMPVQELGMPAPHPTVIVLRDWEVRQSHPLTPSVIAERGPPTVGGADAEGILPKTVCAHWLNY